MPVPKNKRITHKKDLSIVESTSFPWLEQQAFHQHRLRLAQSAVRRVLELVMRQELDAFMGAAWGACTAKRRGYRNGTSTRDLATSTGRLEDLKVPRDRAGQFHTQAFDRYRRSEPQVAEATHGAVRSGGQHTSGGGSGSNSTGSRFQRQHHQSAQPEPHATI